MSTHRIRRGNLVEIPEKWRNCVPSNQTLRQRRVKAKMVRLERKKRVRRDQDIYLELNSD